MKEPFYQTQHIVVGSYLNYDVEIVLKETTDSIERALDHGVAFRSNARGIMTWTILPDCSSI